MFRKAVHKDSWKIPRRNGPLGNVLLILLFVQMVFWTKAQQPTELIQSSTSSLSQRLWALVDGTRSLVQSQRGGEHLEASQRSVFGFGCFTPETLKLKFQRNGKAKYFSCIIHSHKTTSFLERICFIKKKKIHVWLPVLSASNSLWHCSLAQRAWN